MFGPVIISPKVRFVFLLALSSMANAARQSAIRRSRGARFGAIFHLTETPTECVQAHRGSHGLLPKTQEGLLTVSFRLYAALLGIALAPAIAGGAAAQTSVRVRGTITKVGGNLITVKGRDGADTTVHVPDTVAVIATDKRTLADIKPCTFIGTGAMPGDDGVWRAAEVHIFPESMRGSGEGHRAWEAAGSSMTNATVSETVTGVSGHTFTLKFPAGEVKVMVTPETPIVAFVGKNRSDITSGKAIFIPAALKAEDGTLRASRIMVEGTAPPPM